MRQYGISFWKTVPFLRLLIPLVTGVLLGVYCTIPLSLIFSIIVIALSFIFLSRFFISAKKYITRWLNGICFHLVLIGTGIILIWLNDIRQQKKWIGHYPHSPLTILVTVQEPLTEKDKSFKTTVNTTAILLHNQWQPISGKLIIYFRKDSLPNSIQYGTELLLHTSLQDISNSGNPGGFDYRQYCAFQGIYHQAFLKRDDYQLTGKIKASAFTTALFRVRNKVLGIIKKYIPGDKEAGVAEALLLGYRNDLDKALVQVYSNTGVVHIIAISGLHLGMIYGLLVFILKPLKKTKWLLWLKPLIILAVLWGFSLLTGAAASILRSAVMFSFIVASECIGRKPSIYNTLAASAFCLLIYNPFLLWDVGFQLSYTAVLSIVLFMKPVYRWLYIENKLLSMIWQLNAITLSAQVLTLPLVLFYFHQFPNLFLFANFIAVPLSGFILYGELLLLVFAAIPRIDILIGKAVWWMIHQMNGYIERTGSLPFAITDNIRISLIQTIILYMFFSFIAWWLLNKKAKACCAGLFFLLLFMAERSWYLVNTARQQKLVVYNIPRYTAIDIIEGTRYRFIGDSSLYERALYNFHLRPARIQLGVSENASLNHIFISKNLITTARSSILIINNWPVPGIRGKKINADIIIFSGNPRVKLAEVAAIFNCTQYVFDSSNPLWKIRYWKKDADSLHLRHHSIPELGAFEVTI